MENNTDAERFEFLEGAMPFSIEMDNRTGNIVLIFGNNLRAYQCEGDSLRSAIDDAMFVKKGVNNHE